MISNNWKLTGLIHEVLSDSILFDDVLHDWAATRLVKFRGNPTRAWEILNFPMYSRVILLQAGAETEVPAVQNWEISGAVKIGPEDGTLKICWVCWSEIEDARTFEALNFGPCCPAQFLGVRGPS